MGLWVKDALHTLYDSTFTSLSLGFVFNLFSSYGLGIECLDYIYT